MIAPVLGTSLVASLAAAATALGTWSVVRMAFDAANGDRRRIKKRLTVQATADQGVKTAQRSIRNDAPAMGLEARLLQYKICREVDALVQLSYPDIGLPKFLGIVGAIVFTVLM
ncbi:hypothetical protein EON77_19325, partial [bacterium]